MKILWLFSFVLPLCIAFPFDPLETALSRKSCTPSQILQKTIANTIGLIEVTVHTFRDNVVVRVPPFQPNDPVTHPSEPLQRRDQRPKCSPGQTRLDALSRLEGILFSKRVMTLPGRTRADKNMFMFDEVAAAEGVIHAYTISTATYYPFKNEAMSLAVSGLCGCTTLVIVSRQAVYFGHYFENLSFDPDRGVPHGHNPEAAFQNTVLNGLRSGVLNAQGGWDQDSLTAHAAAFRGGKAFLIIPSVGLNDNRDPYRDKWNRMKTTVQQIIPGGIDIKEVLYDPLKDTSPLLETTYRGKVLFKYDPQEQKNTPRRLSKLWSEVDELHTDAW